MNLRVPPTWRSALEPVIAGEQGAQLTRFLAAEKAAGKTIYPPEECRLRALELTPLDQVKVVILGQDPYHGTDQAMGLSFAVPAGVRVPPSLVNIYKELAADLGISRPAHGDLSGWAQQGVLLLNTTLTVEGGKAGSHAGQGWEAVTQAVLHAVVGRGSPTVFVLWGAHAQAMARRVSGMREGTHCLIESPHPSPLSAHRGFFGSRPFSRANGFLAAHGVPPLDWCV